MSKKILKSLLGIFVGLFLLSLISASMTVSYNLAYGILEDNGALTTTSTSIAGANAAVYTCLNSQCTSAGSLITTASTSSSILPITFPETLQSTYGYVVYVYKTGYVGWEQINVIRYGNGAVTSSTIFYLSKNRNGYAPINSFSVQNISSNITINTNISTSSQRKTESNIPLSENVLTNIRLDIYNNSGLVYSENSNDPIEYSSSIKKTYTYSNLPCGNYTFLLTTLPVDAKILNPQQRQASYIFNMTIGCSIVPPITLPVITIVSPINKNYTNNTILLNATSNQAITSWKYSLNGAANISFTNPTLITCPNGTNTLFVYGTNSNGTGSTSVNFYVNSTTINPPVIAPVITAISPIQNNIYNTTNILLNATSNQAITSWLYNLNNAGNITFIPGNIYNLPLINGTNTILIYGTNSNGTGSATINFVYNSSSDGRGSIPIINLLSPIQNNIYNTTNILLNATSNQAITSWLYNLNNAGNITFIPGNIYNLPLINGTNTILIYGTNSNGTGSTSVTFTYNSSSNNICTPNWQPHSWSSCQNGKKTRSYFDVNNCNNNSGKPSNDEKSCGTDTEDTISLSSKPLSLSNSVPSNYTIILNTKKQTSEINLLVYWLIILILLIIILIILISIYRLA